MIAVALFAALSYAVTTSGRGGGSVDKEQAVLLAAQITQFGSMVRTAATRIVLSGTSVENLQLCDSADADQFCSQGAGFCNDTSSNPGDCVFAAQGGGVPLQNIPEAAKASAGTQWLVMQENGPLPVVVQGVGTTAADIVMYTGIGITQSVCEAINKGLGLPVPVAADADFLANGLTAYDGEPFFCLLYTGHFYFHTIAER